MIQKAIEKIDGEMKSGGAMEKTLGKYVKSELLTSDANALKILAPNVDLETFTELLRKIALTYSNMPEKEKEPGELSKHIATFLKSIKDDELFDEYSLKLEKLFKENSEKKENGICLTSEIVIPLLHIYYGIPLEQSRENASAPKRRRFNAVSLD